MSVLWLKFPDEMITSHHFSEEDKLIFSNIFSLEGDSPLVKALKAIGLPYENQPHAIIKWYRDIPYFNWSWLSGIISGNTMKAIKSGDSYSFAFSFSFMKFSALLKAHWKITKFLKKDISKLEMLPASIALGIAIQALLMRLGSNSANLPGWLADPETAPAKYRRLIKQIHDIQVKRTSLSPAWAKLFPLSANSSEICMPDFFWDDNIPSDTLDKPSDEIIPADTWRGLPVCGGNLTGVAVIISYPFDVPNLLQLKQKYNAPLILVFKNARPETTELFSHAGAVLFASGGILSHACTIAREMNLPSITALGNDFLKNINSPVWLSIDAASGTVHLVE